MLVKPSSVILVLLFLCLNSTFCSSKGEGGKSTQNVIKGKIVGGTPVPIDKYPFAVVLYNFGGRCAAIILNAWVVMTASHCFDYNDDVEEMDVQVGATYIDDISSELLKVKKVQLHPQYRSPLRFSYDIALVFLESPIKFGRKAKKAVLATNDKWMRENETTFFVTGWGKTKYNGPTSDKGLLMAKLRFITRQKCSLWHKLPLSEDMFCLYGDSERDACHGDSGGGVLWNGQIVGIVSHGDGCADKGKPSVYSNVWYFLPWIRKNVKEYLKRHCYHE